MHAVLYVVGHQDNREWRISLDESLQTDLVYWHRIDPSIRLWRHGDRLPLGIALAALQDRVKKKQSTITLEPVDQSPLQARSRTQSSNPSLMDKLAHAMRGRSLLPEEFVSLAGYLSGEASAAEQWVELVQLGYLEGWLTYEASVRVRKKRIRFGLRTGVEADCRRCGSTGDRIRWTYCASCGELCPYCETCLTMGRARYCAPILRGKGDSRSLSGGASNVLEELKLSPAQAAAAEAGVQFVMSGEEAVLGKGNIRPFLIWAVTGAGKTEMIFPLIAAERGRGGRVLIATPRKDVVLELLPRLRTAFEEERVIALYGGSEERWESADVIVATTHQLLRYETAFDLVVLDEVDAFPYHNDPMLEFAARKACKPGAAFVMLSATPPPELERAVRRGRLPCAKVPVRYHRHPLPVPALRGPGRLVPLLRQSLERGAQAFVFVPQIAWLAPELARLHKALAAGCEPGRIEATSSQDPMRAEKVRQLRTGEIRILLTTTILERGVTIAKADVIVLGADSRLFDTAALVQMAGRAGRSADDPYGQVAFLAKHRTRAQSAAVRQIRSMNRLARKQGYLIEDAGSLLRGNVPFST